MKVAVDTNVLVRSLIRDGSEQTAAAMRCMRENEVVVVPTVLLEAEWVLRDVFELKPAQIADAFEKLFGLFTVTIVQRETVARALLAFQSGCDFADAMHSAFAGGVEAFVTFDKRFARRGNSLGLAPPIRLLAVG